MRLGGPLFESCSDPDAWAAGVRRLGYRAAFCPGGADADDATARAYEDAARKADIVIAEVGAWSNPLLPDAPLTGWQKDAIGKAGGPIQFCQQQLALADRIGARCCVNIAGSRNPDKWNGPSVNNLTHETFDMIVQSVRTIIDGVKPSRTFYTLETMPWIFPDSADSYLALIKAIDRPRFAVHLDPTNLINCPRHAYDTAGLIRECFQKLGPWIKSCHAKDVKFTQSLTLHLDECRPGTGLQDYRTFLTELEKLDKNTTLLIEHLPNAEEYQQAAAYIRSISATL
jgi:sugar phosphate isomerase/epimerase